MSKICVSNWKVKAAMLTLEAEGKCTLNKDARFFPIDLQMTPKNSD
jgi:hypothetical protein